MELSSNLKTPHFKEKSIAFGADFREAREASGSSIRALAQSTRISAHFIEALEQGAFELLPGEVFGRGFVRSICKYLHLDADQMVARFDQCWDHSGPVKSVLEVEIREKPFQRLSLREFISDLFVKGSLKNHRLKKYVALCACLVLVVGGLWRLWSFGGLRNGLSLSKEKPNTVESSNIGNPVMKSASDLQAEVGNPKNLPLETEQAQPLQLKVEGEALPLGQKGVNSAVSTVASSSDEKKPEGAETLTLKSQGQGNQVVELNVIELVRVRADIDGLGAKVKEYAPGTYHIQFNDKVDMMVYDAAALKINFNGQPLGSLGNKGRVRRISFQAKSTNSKTF